MNRTGIFVVGTVFLALVAVAIGLPQSEVAGPVKASPGSLTVVARLTHPLIAPGRQDVFATVDVQAPEFPDRPREPVNLALVIDRSGSMSGFKLQQAKQAARQLVEQLGPKDRLAIVHYGSDARSLQSLLATAENKLRMVQYIDGIWDEGGTNIAAGLEAAKTELLAEKTSSQVSRIILISDGQPTEGTVETQPLVDLVRTYREQGISLSSVGVGDDFNERLMQAFAETGAGAYAFLNDAAQLGDIFQKDLTAASHQVARHVRVQLVVPEGVSFVRAFGHSQVTREAMATGETLVEIALPDLASSQRERLVVQLGVVGGPVGERVSVSAVSVQYDELSGEHAAVTPVQLSAVTSDQPELITQSRDKDAVLYVSRALAAENTQRAADAVEQGRTEEAQGILDDNVRLFREISTLTGPAAVEQDLEIQLDLKSGVDRSKSEGSGRVMQKQMRTQARRDFGLIGSTY